MMARAFRKILAPLLCAALFMGGSFPARAAEAAFQKYSYIFFGTFDTVVTLIGYAPDKETFDRAATSTEGLFTRLHKQYNRYVPYEGVNNLYTLNQEAGKAPVQVSDELFALLAYCKERYSMTRGYVNIALGAVLDLWHDERENAEMDPQSAKAPDMEALRAASAHTDIEDVILNESLKTVFYRDPLLKLDVGAVAKGYATELAAQALLQSDMPHFILNAGGNVRAGLSPTDGRANWGVAIQDPDAEMSFFTGNETLDVLYVSGKSVVTSGDYQRFFIVDGVRYHHLIHPLTLFPASFSRSVTIVTEDSGLADLMSTCVFLMSYEEGRAFVESLPGVDALWVLPDGKIHMTDGVAAMSQSRGAAAK